MPTIKHAHIYEYSHYIFTTVNKANQS